MLYDSTATITNDVVQGVGWGKVNCTNIEKCGKSEEEMCKNLYLGEFVTEELNFATWCTVFTFKT